MTIILTIVRAYDHRDMTAVCIRCDVDRNGSRNLKVFRVLAVCYILRRQLVRYLPAGAYESHDVSYRHILALLIPVRCRDRDITCDTEIIHGSGNKTGTVIVINIIPV